MKDTVQKVLNAVPSPIFIADRNHRLVMVNYSFCSFMARDRAALIGSTLADIVPPELRESVLALHKEVFESGVDIEREESASAGDGPPRHYLSRLHRIHVDDEPMMLVMIEDVTAFRRAEAESRHRALHDPLTGLANRALFAERVSQALLRARRRGCCALLFIDMDHFKQVNDTLGHAAGDALLRAFAARVQAIIRESDTLARLGGDEFAILLTDIEGAFDARATCQRLLAVMKAPFDLPQGRVFVGASVGIAQSEPGTTLSPDELQRRADLAAYEAKRAGRGCFRTYSPRLDEHRLHRAQLEQDLHAALSTGDQFELQYQPMVDARDGRVLAVEALLRWRHPRFGLMMPDAFLGVAEATGTLVALGDWVIDEATRLLARFEQVALAVNLSSGQLQSEDLIERTQAILARNGFPPARLQLEISEQTLLAADEKALEQVNGLRAAGMKIVLDNFGTGYSLLSRLRRMELDKLKVDRTLVRDLSHSPHSLDILQAMAGLGRTLGIPMTAEGIEQERERRMLHAAGCSELQGYFFSHPLDQAAVRKLLEPGIAQPAREAMLPPPAPSAGRAPPAPRAG